MLEEGGCASVCLNVCKLPTQKFFNELGLAVTLEPNYETFEVGQCSLTLSNPR